MAAADLPIGRAIPSIGGRVCVQFDSGLFEGTMKALGGFPIGTTFSVYFEADGETVEIVPGKHKYVQMPGEGKKRPASPAQSTKTAKVGKRASPRQSPKVEPKKKSPARKQVAKHPAAAAAEDELSPTVTMGRVKRQRKSTTMMVDGQAVLKLNNYSLEHGEPSISAATFGLVEPAKPKSAKSAYVFFCAQQASKVSGLQFQERASTLATMWQSVEDRRKYMALAAADKQRQATEMEEYEHAMDDWEERKEAAAAAADAAEQAQMEADESARKQRDIDRAQRAAAAAANPKPARELSTVEAARLAHNRALAADVKAAVPVRQAFYLQHLDAIRPFLSEFETLDAGNFCLCFPKVQALPCATPLLLLARRAASLPPCLPSLPPLPSDPCVSRCSFADHMVATVPQWKKRSKRCRTASPKEPRDTSGRRACR